MSRRGQIILLILLLAGGAYGWVKYQEYAANVAPEQARKQAREQALIGDRVLKIPTVLPMDTPDQLMAITKCKGFGTSLRSESKLCSGEGELFSIPGNIDVERLNNDQVHQLVYSFALPARKRLIASLSDLFGPAHEFDLPHKVHGLCWVLPDKQMIILEWEESNDAEDAVSVYINSQVATQVLQWEESRSHTC